MATKFGEYLEAKMINKSQLGRKTGLTRQRISELSVRAHAQMKLEEGYNIARALGVSVDELCSIVGIDKKKK